MNLSVQYPDGIYRSATNPNDSLLNYIPNPFEDEEIEPSEKQKVCQCHKGLNHVYRKESESEKKERESQLLKNMP
jgi:hypothetical protein